MDIKLRGDESLLATDFCLYFKGPIAFHGKLSLTNQRLIFEPIKKVDQMIGVKPFFVESFKIRSATIEGLEKHLSIKTNDGQYVFSGNGAHRIHERLEVHLRSLTGQQLNLNDIDILNEKVLLQGDIKVFLRGKLHTKGQIILTLHRLRVESFSSLETMFFSHKSMNTLIERVSAFRFESVGRILTIKTKKQSITIGGPLCPEIFLYLQAIKDGHFNSNRPSFPVALFQGLLSIHGRLLATSKRLLFCPSERLDTLVGAKPLSIPLHKISHIEITGWPEKRMSLVPTEGEQIVIGMEAPNDRLQQLLETLCSFPQKPLFPDIRSGNVSSNRASKKLKSLNVDIGKEEIQLVEWGLYIESNDCVRLGWLLLTKDKLRFIARVGGVLWEAKVKEISKARNSRDHDPIIQLVVSHKKYIFTSLGGGVFNKLLWIYLTGIKPEQEAKTGRTGQSIRRVIGNFNHVNILRGSIPILELKHIEIEKKPQGLRMMVPRMNSSPFQINDMVQVEVPRPEGRFRFFCKIRENYTCEPDPIGRYYITFSIPKEIVVFNQRSSFRVSFTQQTVINTFSTEMHKSPSDFRLNDRPNQHYEDDLFLTDNSDILLSEDTENTLNTTNLFNDDENTETQHTIPNIDVPEFEDDDGLIRLGDQNCRLFDISLGGCAFCLENSILERLELPQDRVFFKLTLPFDRGNISVLAKLINIRPHVSDERTIIHGCQFFNVSKMMTIRLKQEILQLEREQIRELIMLENQSRKMGLL